MRIRAQIAGGDRCAQLRAAAGAGGRAGRQPGPVGQLSIVRRLNLELVELVRNLGGAHLLDIDHLFSRIGHEHCRDERGARTSDSPLSQSALRLLAEAQIRHLRALSGAAIKCVVVDCDNTLWGGVVGEDGIDGLDLGPTGAGRRPLRSSAPPARSAATRTRACYLKQERGGGRPRGSADTPRLPPE